MFNTGTVVGVAANIFGDGFPRNFIPSFAWGGASGYSTYRTSKAFEMMERVLERRGVDLTVQDRLILLRVYEDTAKYRRWEKKDEEGKNATLENLVTLPAGTPRGACRT